MMWCCSSCEEVCFKMCCVFEYGILCVWQSIISICLYHLVCMAS